MHLKPETAIVLASALEQSPESFFLTDGEGRISYANPALEKLTGYKAADLLGKTPAIFKSGRQTPDFYRALWSEIKAGRPWSGRMTNRRADGSLFDEHVTITPVITPAGAVSGFLAQVHDITRELALESQLNQAQKMESLGLLAGQTAHDFNNLLTVIIGSMELIQEDLKEDSVSMKLAREILRSSKEYANLIKQLMLFTRRGESKPAAIDINAPLSEVRVLLDSLLGKGIKAAYGLAPGLRPVRADADHLKQALMNLAANARDAMGGRGRLFVSTRRAGPAGLPPSLPEGMYAVLEVADDGPGIPEAILGRIFEPFFTTKPKGKGTGLGLSTVYGVVRQAGGQVFAANRPEGGAIFSIYLPELP